MTPLKLVVWITSLTGGAVGLFAPVGVVKWLLQTEPRGRGDIDVLFPARVVPAGGGGAIGRAAAGGAADRREAGLFQPLNCNA